MTVLYIAHTECDGTLAKISLEALGAAKSLADGMGADLAVGLIGADVAAAANSVAGCGAKFYAATDPALANGVYGGDLAAAEAIAKAVSPEVVVAPATSRLSRALPGLAVRLDGRVDTHLSGLKAVDGKPVASRWFYRQRMEGTLTREERPWIVTLDSGCADAFEGAGSADVEAVVVDLSGVRTKHAGMECVSEDQQTIRPDADVLLVAGAGWTKKQADGGVHVDVAETLILDFLGTTKASLGSSKSLVDISGEGGGGHLVSDAHAPGGGRPAHPHAIPRDCPPAATARSPMWWAGALSASAAPSTPTRAAAGRRGKCDVLYVGDAFEIMKKVNELLA